MFDSPKSQVLKCFRGLYLDMVQLEIVWRNYEATSLLPGLWVGLVLVLFQFYSKQCEAKDYIEWYLLLIVVER